MPQQLLCADKSCKVNKHCKRYVVDPANELSKGNSVRVETTFRDQKLFTCQYFQPITITLTGATTNENCF